MAPRPSLSVRWSPGHWATVRKVVQVAALLAFVVLFVWSRRGGWPAHWVNAPMRLEPLATLAHALASRTLLVGSTLSLLTVALTLLFGRAWCGWLCPMGTALDMAAPRRARGRAVPEAWRMAKYALLLTILWAALLGNLTLLVFDPLTILFRTLSAAVWPAVDQLVSGAQALAYRVPFLQEPVAALDMLARPKVLPPDPALYRMSWLFAAVFTAIAALNWWTPRFWCRYLCPLGALLGLLSKVSLLRRQVNSRCISCDACARACPTGAIRGDQGYRGDPSECTVCLDCLAVCPQGAVEFARQRRSAAWSSYDPGRRQALAGLGVALAGVGLFRSDAVALRDHPHLIRPPGARENNLLAKCIRCGECSRACPTSAIQPALWESGLEGLWTPTLIPRLGYCDYSCHACGQVCPVQAIPPLTLEQKRQRVIGTAYINTTRCIPWADGGDCIVCEEMCPIPQKAIVLEEVDTEDALGRPVTVKRPHVVRERCIGCGICEFKCPLNGESAIRVYVPNDVTPV
ncbi:MAG: 4Fe-4S dicluster domain-containing protein [Chloroflexi bacterium]|nr:4Fe-4S dicluster domain-containing protein [Chloroflexota bacterium]